MAHSSDQNLRGIIFMTVSMAGFAIEDAFIKVLSRSMSSGQILMFLGTGGAIFFALMILRARLPLFQRELLHRTVIIRNIGEVIGTIGFVTAIILTPLSSASAILQSTPLLITLGAALFLGEQVGWRRWAAICVGLFGVLLIIRPGFSAFEPASLFAVQGVIGLAIRDLATRRIPENLSSLHLSALAFGLLVPVGFLLGPINDGFSPMSPAVWGITAITVAIGLLAYYAITAAMRLGEVSVITPFRYSRLVFALIIGISFFGETPDTLTLVGAAIIIGSGLYTLAREQRLKRKARQKGT